MPPSVLLVKSLSPMTPENRDNGKLRGWQNTHHRGMSREWEGQVSPAPFFPGTARAALALSSLESQLSAVVATRETHGREGAFQEPPSRGLWKDPSPLHACIWKICEQWP